MSRTVFLNNLIPSTCHKQQPNQRNTCYELRSSGFMPRVGDHLARVSRFENAALSLNTSDGLNFRSDFPLEFLFGTSPTCTFDPTIHEYVKSNHAYLPTIFL